MAGSEIGPENASAALTDTTDFERAVYYQDDEAVRLAVRFDVNFVAVYKSYYAWWYFPNGRVYQRQPVRNEFGTHLSLVTSMAIRGHPPADWPGEWKVRLTLRNRLLVEEAFEIRKGARPPPGGAPGAAAAMEDRPAAGTLAAASPSMAAPSTGAPPPREPPLCPDPGSPPGWCNWEAPEEGGRGPVHPSAVAPAAPRAANVPGPASPPAPALIARTEEPVPATDLPDAAWIPLPGDPSRFAPLCPDPGSSPGRCNWQAPEEGGP